MDEFSSETTHPTFNWRDPVRVWLFNLLVAGSVTVEDVLCILPAIEAFMHYKHLKVVTSNDRVTFEATTIEPEST